MANVSCSRSLPVDATTAFSWVADPRTHSLWVPLSKLNGGPRPSAPGIGDQFTMVSGPLVRASVPGFPDRMMIIDLTPPTAATPGTARFSKLGPFLLGTAGFVVSPITTQHCVVTWWEDTHLRAPLPRRVSDPPVQLFLAAMMNASLRRLRRLVASGLTPGN